MRLLILAALVAGLALPAAAQSTPTTGGPWPDAAFMPGGPLNDNVDAAFPLAPNAPAVVLSSTTVGATPDPLPQFRLPTLGASCTGGENDQSVWWTFRATTTGTATIDLAGSSFDTVLSVYNGATGSLPEVACNDDFGAVAQSRITDMPVTADTYYFVRVSGFGTTTGTVQIAMTSTAVTGPPNDIRDRYYGQGFTTPGFRYGFNTGATTTPGEATAPATCSGEPGFKSVWWGYAAQQAGFLTINLAGSTFDTILLVTTESGTVLACNDDVGPVRQSRIANLPVTANTFYYIRVASYLTTESGTITFNTSFSTTPTAGEDGAAAAAVTLRAPQPNPTTGRTSLGFALDAAGPARLAVVDALGREVAVLFDGPAAAGETVVSWDASALPAGVYAARLVAGGRVQTQRVTVVR